jgi:hypothetical protein
MLVKAGTRSPSRGKRVSERGEEAERVLRERHRHDPGDDHERGAPGGRPDRARQVIDSTTADWCASLSEK